MRRRGDPARHPSRCEHCMFILSSVESGPRILDCLCLVRIVCILRKRGSVLADHIRIELQVMRNLDMIHGNGAGGLHLALGETGVQLCEGGN